MPPAFLPALLLASALAAPPPPQPALQVSAPVQVSLDHPDIPHVEPHLSAHPTKPNLLIGAAVTFPTLNPPGGLRDTLVAGFRSTDGGATWSRFALPECRIDPWTAFAGDRALVLCMDSDSSLRVYASDDGGETWTEGGPLPRGEGGPTDRPVLAVAPATEKEGEKEVYAVYGQSFPAQGFSGREYGASVSTSTDGGTTFGEPVFVRHDNLQQQPFDAEVLSDGTLVVFFMDYATDRRLLDHRRTWMVRSTDGGATFSTPVLVHEQRHREMPWSVAVDRSPKHRDRHYVVIDGHWRREGPLPDDPTPGAADRTGLPPGLFLRSSDDGGLTWSAPVEITPSSPGTHQEVPAVAVNRDGVVGVSWYDTRHSPVPSGEVGGTSDKTGGGWCFDLYFSASLDGGATFLPPVRVTPETSCPRANEAQRGIATRWAFGGDYHGLTAGADGRFHVFWADSRSGVYQVWGAGVAVTDR